MGTQIMVYAYLAVCACMIIFNCICVVRFKRKDKASIRRDSKFKTEVRRQVAAAAEGIPVSDEHISHLKRKCVHVQNLASLDEELDALIGDNSGAVSLYLGELQPLFGELAGKMSSADDIQRAHFGYMLEKYDILHKDSPGSIRNALMDMIHSPNLYCRENALKVFYKAGITEWVTDALLSVSKEGYFHHEKLIVDGLMKFTGDIRELIDCLLDKIYEFSPYFRVCILNCIRFSGAKYDELCLRIISDNNADDELRFSALRYFGRNYYEPAYDIIYGFAANPQLQRWEYTSIAAAVLSTYPRPQTIEVLKSCLSHRNWFIRKNAAESLERLDLSYRELADIFDGRDRYAREILQYQREQSEYSRSLKEGAAI